MRRLLLLGAVLAVVPVASFTACTSTHAPGWGDPPASNATSDQAADQAALAAIAQYPFQPVCARVRDGGGMMRCHAKVRTDEEGNVTKSAAPQGFGPSDLRSAYNLPASGGSGKIVAVVDAYDDANAESDLAAYRTQYGLPACTTANGCFKKVNQNGQTSPAAPPDTTGWSGEIALDLDMVSAVCPDCKIVLVEANSATTDDLGAGVNAAASLGASAISNSYGGGEDSSVSAASTSYYNHPGILVTASSGDSGFSAGPQFPATSPFVLAVGGTSLAHSTSTRGWAEQAWSSAGSGCSGVFAKPSWQKDTGCSKRMEADVSAVADPNTGVAVYQGGSWQVYGGTSASSPLVAAAYTLLGLATQPTSYGYSHASAYYDVTSGSNGSCSGSASYECKAGVGYDGPTGVGTPNGAALASGGGSSSSSSSGSGSGSGSTSSGSGSSSGSDGGGSDGGSSSGSDGGSSSGSSSSSSGSSSGSSSSSSGSSGGGSCKHPVCATGVALTPSCSTCAADVCAKDSYCCQVQWDGICVSEVPQDCPGQSCTGGGGSSSGSSSSSSGGSSSSSSSGGSSGGGAGCAHAVCTAGVPLTATCSTCAGDVCAADSYCCQMQWDQICVSEVATYCSGQSCP
jgi:hypothetical protein